MQEEAKETHPESDPRWVCVYVCVHCSVCVGMKVVTHKSEQEGESESCYFCPQLW